MNWRDLGDTTFEAFEAEIRRRAPRSPLLHEVEAIYNAVKPHSRLFLGMCWIEDQYMTDPSTRFPISYNNLMNMKTPDGSGWMQFDSLAAGAKGWRERITSPTYKNGIYANTKTVAELVHVYAPAFDNNDEANYVRTIGVIVDSLPKIPDQSDPGGPMPRPIIGHVPKPPMIDRTDLGRNHRIGSGRDPDQPRAGFIVGTCHHTSEGYDAGNIDVLEGLVWGGLWDFQIGGRYDGAKNGVITQIIGDTDPVVPWANGKVGDARAPYGDAPAFLTKYGTNGVNRRLRSIECADGTRSNEDKTAEQIESLCFLTAWIHAEQAGQTAETFEWNMHHREFGVAHQGCPGAYIVEHVDEIQNRTKAIMRAYQYGDPLNPPLRVTYPAGWKGPKVPPPPTATSTTTPAPEPPPVEYADRITTGLTGEDTQIKRKVTIKTGEKDSKGKAITEQIDVVFDVFELERPFEVVFKTKRRQGPDSRQPIVGPPLEVRETFGSRYYAVPRKQAGKKIPTTQYVLTEIATWVQANHLSPRISIRKA